MFNFLKILKLPLLLLIVLLFGFSTSSFAVKSVYESYIANINSKVEFLSEFPGGQFGASLASGDFNGDGIDDLAVGAPFASNSKQWVGAVKIIFGGDENIENAIFYGENAGDQLGSSISVGDYNYDGIDDIAMGAYRANGDAKNSGRIYVMYGGTDLVNQLVDFNMVNADFEVGRGLSGAGFGLAAESTDLNNDNFDDLIVSAPFASNRNVDNAGIVFVYFGSIYGLIKPHNITIYGNIKNERFGSSIASGDFDADGKQELFIGAYLANVGVYNQSGKVYYYDLDLKNSKDASLLFTTPDYEIVDESKSELFGFALDVNDLNKDNHDDLVVTSFPYFGNQENAHVSVFYGGDFDVKPDVVVKSPLGEAFLGSSVQMEDFNGDGFVDIALGAPGINFSKSIEEGSVYLIYGKESGFETSYSVTDLDIDSIIHGENLDDWFGYALEALDINNDGLEDLVVGSRYSDGESSINDGKVFVLFGNDEPYGVLRAIKNVGGDEISRGSLLKIVLDSFDIYKKKSTYINNCYSYIDFCLFNFMAMSSFDGIELSPQLILYPDVHKENEYYEDINTATILGLVNGYMNETNSPFKPDLPVTRIQALKIVLGAADLVPTKYKFELIAMLGSYQDLISQKSYFEDVDTEISHMWWYPRYLNFAVENGILEDTDYFRPDDNISSQELDEMINNTLEYINSINEEN
ncbi:MAG: S-layer homology domain-containing protein [bacterium]|nr:S-layer homology domain-containing protein [bacterium]